MKFTCGSGSLMEAINIVQKAVTTKSTMEILEGILIEAYNDEIKFTTNDLEIAIEYKIDANVINEGTALISARTFGDVIKKMPSGEVIFEMDNSGVAKVDSNSSHYDLKTMDPSGFPKLNKIKEDEEKKSFTLQQDILREMIRQTVFAVSDDENRPIFQGVFVEKNGKDINFVAIDGSKLALRKEIVDGEDNGDSLSCIIPGKTLNEVSKILQTINEEVNIVFNDKQIMFSTENCIIVSRLIEGEYLNYRAMIPKESKLSGTINTKDFYLAVERASLVSVDDRKNPLIFDIADDKIVITCNGELGASKEEIDFDMIGENLEIGFNFGNLAEALKVIDEDTVTLNFTTNLGPCTIVPVEEDSFVYLVMPVKLRNS